MDLQSAVVVNETQFSEPVHEIADSRTSGAHHLGQCFLTDFWARVLAYEFIGVLTPDLFQAQLAIVLLGNSVALAGGVLKFVAVHDLHCAPGVLDEPLPLQNTGS